MRKIRHLSIVSLLLLIAGFSYGQDPSFSQFFSSPLNVNPALTGNINGDWRFISNVRDQWIGPASPYATGTVSFDSKIIQNKIPNVAEKNIMAVGGMLMYDYAMNGVVKSTYGSLNLSYNIKLSEDEYGRKQRLGVGFGGTYGHTYIDFSKLNFQEQFTGTGFNTNLPSGETALTNTKAYVSASAGLLYTFSTEKSNLDIGVAGYHLNKPKQTFLADPNQYLPVRAVFHANYETFLNERTVFNANGIYQFQNEAKYFSVGGALGYYVSDDQETLFNAGLWYWSSNAIIPYLGMTYRDFQIGVSYDMTVSKLSQATRKPNTFELSLILRGTQKGSGVIPCPWK
jgi:type IX secretion system PorP/SprF family membrane protein